MSYFRDTAWNETVFLNLFRFITLNLVNRLQRIDNSFSFEFPVVVDVFDIELIVVNYRWHPSGLGPGALDLGIGIDVSDIISPDISFRLSPMNIGYIHCVTNKFSLKRRIGFVRRELIGRHERVCFSLGLEMPDLRKASFDVIVLKRPGLLRSFVLQDV